MTQLPTLLEEWLDMLDFFQLLRIYRHICRFISTKGSIEMELAFISLQQLKSSTRGKMDYLTIIEELWAGIQSLSKLIHPAALYFL